jgi:hypothetical protein
LTTRASRRSASTGIEPRRHDFGALDQAAAVAEIRRLTEAGLSETQIVKSTGWSLVDVRRVLGRSSA